jgi:hypothetical protein
MFHLNREEHCNKDSLTQTHIKRLKTGTGSYLDLEVSIFVKIFGFDLVIQSL